MSFSWTVLLASSIAGIAAILVRRAILASSIAGIAAILARLAIRERNWPRMALHGIAILAYLGFVHVAIGFPRVLPETVPKGATDDLVFVVLLYLSMFIGMVVHYVFDRFEQTRVPAGRFDIGLFLAPVFASQIVFIPLITTLQASTLTPSQEGLSRMMVFFIAFQNGFLWKDYFDHRRREEGAR
jgi:hypothetical protein